MENISLWEGWISISLITEHTTKPSCFKIVWRNYEGPHDRSTAALTSKHESRAQAACEAGALAKLHKKKPKTKKNKSLVVLGKRDFSYPRWIHLQKKWKLKSYFTEMCLELLLMRSRGNMLEVRNAGKQDTVSSSEEAVVCSQTIEMAEGWNLVSTSHGLKQFLQEAEFKLMLF